jgi:hypothetical protein
MPMLGPVAIALGAALGLVFGGLFETRAHRR